MAKIPGGLGFKELKKAPEFDLLIRHGKMGFITIGLGVAVLVLVVILHGTRLPPLPDYAWGAILSVPVTVLCMGFFSVFYEFYMRRTFVNSMRSIFWAWDTGVTVLPSHRNAPNRRDVLAPAVERVRIMSTTLNRYFVDVGAEVERKIARENVKFQLILYDPDSDALAEKAREEGMDVAEFREEIQSACRRDLGRLVRKYPDRIEVRFCGSNVPFGITIIDDVMMVLSLNVVGLARSKDQTPCLVIENKYDRDSVFKLYENSFDTIWAGSPRDYPPQVKQFF